jgi:uridine kinase
LIPLLPLLAEIDRKRAKQERVLLAIEGGSAAGKTTLAAQLEQIYGCTVFHMDDFFLRPEQRTPERLAQPGGNVDYERFLAEVLEPLAEGVPVHYRRYDCHTQSMQSAVEIKPTPLVIVEGAYSMHPALAEYYDLSVFLDVAPEAQRERILRRNGPVVAERFFTQWIPLERLYFDGLHPLERCSLRICIEE